MHWNIALFLTIKYPFVLISNKTLYQTKRMIIVMLLLSVNCLFVACIEHIEAYNCTGSLACFQITAILVYPLSWLRKFASIVFHSKGLYFFIGEGIYNCHMTI